MGIRATANIGFGVDLGSEDDFLKSHDEMNEIVDRTYSSPIMVVTHGHYEYPFYTAIISETYGNTGDWGECIDFDSLEKPTDDKIKMLLDWCKENDFEIVDEPSWLVSASYG